MAPDLRASVIPLDFATFASVVRDGAKANLGMPARPEFTDEQLKALQHFIRREAATFAGRYDTFIEEIKAGKSKETTGFSH